MCGDQTDICAVALGKRGFCGLLSSWGECKQLVRGAKGCVYKISEKGQRAQAIAFVRKYTTTRSRGLSGDANLAAPAGQGATKRVAFSDTQTHRPPAGVPLAGTAAPAPAPAGPAPPSALWVWTHTAGWCATTG